MICGENKFCWAILWALIISPQKLIKWKWFCAHTNIHIHTPLRSLAHSLSHTLSYLFVSGDRTRALNTSCLCALCVCVCVNRINYTYMCWLLEVGPLAMIILYCYCYCTLDLWYYTFDTYYTWLCNKLLILMLVVKKLLCHLITIYYNLANMS